MKVCIYECVCVCVSMHDAGSLRWRKGTLLFEGDAPGSTPVIRACELFSHLFFSLLWAVSAGASKINITSFFVNSVSFAAAHCFSEKPSTALKCERRDSGGLGGWYHPLLFTVHFLLSYSLSHPVIQCVTAWAKPCIFSLFACARDVWKLTAQMNVIKCPYPWLFCSPLPQNLKVFPRHHWGFFFQVSLK